MVLLVDAQVLGDHLTHQTHILVHNIAEIFAQGSLVEYSQHLKHIQLRNLAIGIRIKNVERELHQELVVDEDLLQLDNILLFVDVSGVVKYLKEPLSYLDAEALGQVLLEAGGLQSGLCAHLVAHLHEVLPVAPHLPNQHLYLGLHVVVHLSDGLFLFLVYSLILLALMTSIITCRVLFISLHLDLLL